MTPTRNAVLVCLLFLCGLEETVSQLGRCKGNQCFALFQKPEDFEGARKSCKDTEGQLFTYDEAKMGEMLTVLPGGLSGRFWLELQGSGTRNSAGLQNCPSVSMALGRNLKVLSEPCHEKLNGFLCQYKNEDPCGPLRIGADAQVNYTTYRGMEVLHSDTFPRGTFAVAGKPGAKHPDSKHLCFLRNWMQAPWSCEVFEGGCEHGCNTTIHNNQQTYTCTCPPEESPYPNKITCGTDPCALCAQGCKQVGDTYVCTCSRGYRLAQDKRSCVDVNECEEQDPCTGEGQVCKNTQGGFQCMCKFGFMLRKGVCVDATICRACEHLLCDDPNGVFECMCRKGYKVSATDPTLCDVDCAARDCPASCVKNNNVTQCRCPDGYILDSVNNTDICTDINECEHDQCDHDCENFYGGYNCSCHPGYELRKGHKCVLIKEEEEEEEVDNDGSGSTPPNPTAPSAYPAAVPSYIKTGSVLGITVFLLLCGCLLFIVIQSLAKRCGRFELTSLKHQNIDIFYLQQVTSETYKRLSFDKESTVSSHQK